MMAPSCVSPGGLDEPATGEVSQGITVTTEVVAQDAQITSGGDHYVHAIDLTNGGWCEFETTLRTMPDTVITLENAGFGAIATDDDSGPGLGSRIVWNLPAGRYYVDVRGYASSQTGSWQLAVSCGTDPVLFHENFQANGDPGQCGGQTGIQSAIMGTWTRNVVIDADNRSGWCEQQFGVTDPQAVYAGLGLAVNFFGNGDTSQCVFAGPRPIPVSAAIEPSWSSVYGIDTDGRSGGCWQVFSLSGRSDVALDVEFLANGDGQCGNTGTYMVTSDAARAFLIDTDNKAGGCTQRFRLKQRPPCTPRTFCNAGECGTVSNGCGGSLDCGTCGGGDGCVTSPTTGSNVVPICST